MAEAHQAVHLLEENSYHHTQLVYDADDEFLTIRINKALYTSLYRYIKNHLVGLRNEIRNSIFPHSVWNCVVSLVAPPLLMFSRHACRLPYGTAAHNIMWRVANALPMGRVSGNGRAAVTSILTGSTIFVGLVLVRRYVLRALLGYRGWMYETRSKSWRTLGWCAGVRLLTGSRPLLYSFQRSLPRLPVPSLQDTVTRYLETIEHVLPAEEYAKQVQHSKTFLASEGPKLQRYLILKSWLTDNYVTDWWEKYVYLRGRSPIMINSNYYVGDLAIYQATTVPCARAASLAWRCLRFKELVDTQELEPMIVHGAVPMCMAQYKRLFATTRVPGEECDELVHFKGRESRHVAVLANGSWFVVDMYTNAGELLDPHDMEIQFERVWAQSLRLKPTDTEARIAGLTAGDRTEWARARSRFFAHGINKYSLDMIERALFVVVLDHRAPTDVTEQSYLSMHGSGYDRWFDKSFTLIVYANGKAGLNCEHAWADAPVIGHMWEMAAIAEAVEGCFNSQGRNIPPPNAKKRALPAPRVLQWSLNGKEAQQAIQAAVDSAQELINDLHLKHVSFDEFGKGLMKQWRVSPDAYIQQALQLAYAKGNNGQVALTYESSMTRLYQLGRTETVRSATRQSRTWVKSMLDESVPATERARLFRQACDRHQVQYRDAMSGRGVDRHLFALYVTSQGMGVHSEFLRDALSEPWRLSTSQQPQQQTTMWDASGKDSSLVAVGGGFGPVADDGYGVSYMVAGENLVFFHVSSKRSCPATDSDKFGEDIAWALREIRNMLEAAESEKKAAASKEE